METKIICGKCDKDSGYTEQNKSDMITDDTYDLVCDPCGNHLEGLNYDKNG